MPVECLASAPCRPPLMPSAACRSCGSLGFRAELVQLQRLPFLALLRHAGRFSQCPLLGEDRKCSAHCQNDAIDPTETWARLVWRQAGSEVIFLCLARAF